MIGALVSSDEISENITNLQNLFEVKLSDNSSKVRVSSQLVADSRDNEQCFMIDSDFHTTERLEIDDTFTKLKYFNIRAARLNRWAIKDNLNDSMKPSKID